MVDVVWTVGMAACTAVFLAMVLYFHKKNQEELAAEEEERKRKHAAAVAAAGGASAGASGGKQLQLSADEIQRDLDRLCLLFGHPAEPARKREVPKPPPEAPKPKSAPKEVSKPPPAAPKDVPKPPPPAAPKEVPKPPPPAAPKEVPKPPPSAPKEVRKPPVEITEKPAEAQNLPTGSLETGPKARAEGSDESEHIQSEIEQAVKETH